MQKPSPPFSCRYSPNFPELLRKLNCTIALSTYQAGKLIFISAQDDEKVIQLPRNFLQAMAIGIDMERMAIATKDEVAVLANAPGLAPKYSKQPNIYDGFFAPRATYYTGRVDIHGLAWGADGLWTVNTSFSCLALIDDTYSFIPKWKPSVSIFLPCGRNHPFSIFRPARREHLQAVSFPSSPCLRILSQQYFC